MKTAIVTGASGNMGRAIVNKFLKEGYRVTGTVLPGDPLEITDSHFEKAVVDLLNEEETGRFVSRIAEKYGAVDTVIMTVGGFAMGTVAETSLADISKQIRLNFDTAYNLARPAFKQMVSQGQGRIFMTGSRPGLHSFHGSGMVAYSLGKSLLFRLTDLMNDEAKGMDIFTSVIVPSTIDTPQNRASMPMADFSSWVKPETIADIVYYHSSAEASALRDPVIKIYNKC